MNISNISLNFFFKGILEDSFNDVAQGCRVDTKVLLVL